MAKNIDALFSNVRLMECEITLDQVRAVLAEHIRTKTGLSVNPDRIDPIYKGEYDESALVGFEFTVPYIMNP